MNKTVFIFSASNTVAVAGYGLLWWNIFFTKLISPLFDVVGAQRHTVDDSDFFLC